MADGLVYTTPDRDRRRAVDSRRPGRAAPPEATTSSWPHVTGPWAEPVPWPSTRQLDRHHPAGVAHHHLAILAVRPDRQGQGTGTALLDAHHAVLDERGHRPPTWRHPTSAPAASTCATATFARRPGLADPERTGDVADVAAAAARA